ncbi:MAG TPA: hypothetical protein VF590_19205 [Isosphaeraceae bacterium]
MARDTPWVVIGGKAALIAAVAGFFIGSLLIFPWMLILTFFMKGGGDIGEPYWPAILFFPHLVVFAVVAILQFERDQRKRAAALSGHPTFLRLKAEYPDRVALWGEGSLGDAASLESIIRAEQDELSRIEAQDPSPGGP